MNPGQPAYGLGRILVGQLLDALFRYHIDDLFGTRGIYVNSTNEGVAWERPASAELLYPDGREGFQINCGLRIQGGARRG